MAAEHGVLPMELQIGDRLTDETAEWEITGRPYTTNMGKIATPATGFPALSCSVTSAARVGRSDIRFRAYARHA